MEINPKKSAESGKPNKDPNFNYIKFSGLAFEMLAFILLGVWGGYKLDEVLEMKYPIFTICLSLFGVVGSLINLIKKLPKD